MNWIKKTLLVSIASLSLAGCNMYELEELRHTTPSGTAFQTELSRMYMDYATVAEKDYDWFNSWHFADKGLMLAYGKGATPEDLNDWDIPDEARPDLEKARAALLAILTPERMTASPTTAAEAQFYFDCWVKEQEQNWRTEEIANCRDNLMKALEQLNAPGAQHSVSTSELPVPAIKKHKKSLKPETAEKPPEPKKEDAQAKEEKPSLAESTSYAVFFETGKAEVSEPGMNVITEVIKSLRGVSDYNVVLHNSKDHLSKAAERIQVIKKLLVAGGIKESSIHIGTGAAEAEPGKSPARRVEIFLNE